MELSAFMESSMVFNHARNRKTKKKKKSGEKVLRDRQKKKLVESNSQHQRKTTHKQFQ